ncbi:hypothetical protein ACFYRY_29485 [Streptomyces sp. NPDC005263]|uniref:hypothetical protein n=1 Tax=Streptomyces sp. NPDC005263 TaxID=3364711 RepID=UPI00367AF37C
MATMALAAAFAVGAGGLFVDLKTAEACGVGWQCFGGTGVKGAEVEEGEAAWVDTWRRLVTTKGRSEVMQTDAARIPHHTNT